MVERIVSIGLLTQHDLTILGQRFKRHFSVGDDHSFSDLIARLDDLTSHPEKDGMWDQDCNMPER